jgi:dihydropteroate synthase
MDISRVEDTHFRVNRYLRVRDQLLDLSIPKVMGVINVTPDSFHAKSRSTTLKSVLQQTSKMILEGVDIIDIGGYSSRPGAESIDPEEETKRVLPAIRAIRSEFPDVLLSLDTFRSEVAHLGLCEGVDLINDISGGKLDKAMYSTIGKHKAAYIAMHMRGTPDVMQNNTDYAHLLNDLFLFFSKVIREAESVGCNDIMIDPGFGFSKTLEQNYELLNHLDEFQALGKPVVVGLSRKSMIYKKLNSTPEDALNGTTVLNTIALTKGASILRVHDVKEAKQIISLLF